MKYFKILFVVIAVIAVSTVQVDAQNQSIKNPIQDDIKIEKKDIIVHERSAYNAGIIVHKYM